MDVLPVESQMSPSFRVSQGCRASFTELHEPDYSGKGQRQRLICKASEEVEKEAGVTGDG